MQISAGTSEFTEEEFATMIGTMPPVGSITADYLADGAVTPTKLSKLYVGADEMTVLDNATTDAMF